MNFNIRASKLSMIMGCLGSQFFKDLPEQPVNDAALEGTAAAEYLELLLKNQPIGTHAKNGVPFNEDMIHHCKNVADEIRSKAVPGTIASEERLDWTSLSGLVVQGTGDVNFYGHDGRLYIDDLKFGYGIVEPEKNWQLLAYAIGKIMKLGKAVDLVLRIHQPRAHHEDGPTREWIISYSELLKYKEMIDNRLIQLKQGENALSTGPQCRYCPAASHCPAHNKAYYRGLEVVNNFVQDTLSDDELSHQLELIGRFEEIVKTRKGSLELLAISRIGEGKIIPNFTTVSNYGHRKWNHDVTPEAVKMVTGLDLTETVLISPAQAEKRGMTKELADMLTNRPHLGTKLKPTKNSGKQGDKIFGTNQPKKEIK